MFHEFGLETLLELDGGRVVEAWNQALGRVALDCEDRPGVHKPRKVTLELELVPSISDGGHLESVKGSFKVKDSSPVRETKKYDLGVRRQSGSRAPQLVFNDMSDDNVHQRTIDQ